MRSLVLFLLFLGTLSSLAALGRLVQPDGKSVPLAEVETQGSLALLLPFRAIETTSWITLPRGSAVSEVEIAGRGYRGVVSFPNVMVPGLRFAVEIPAHTLSLTLRGRLGLGRTLVRTLQRPGSPGEAWVVLSGDDVWIDLPSWKAASGLTPILTLTRPVEAPWQAMVSNSSESRTFRFEASVLRWDFAPAAWGFVPTRVVVSGSDPRLTEVRVRTIGPGADLPADVPTLLAWPAATWRDPRREWFAWSGTSVLVLVTADYRIQDDYLKRLAFFVEKTGYRGRLVSDSDLAPLHGWNAHDYAAPDLARFFSLASRDHVPLNASEEELRARLTKAGILVPSGDGSWEPGTGALVGISLTSPPALRAVLFTHEAFHGLYFTSPAFRSGVAQIWDTLSVEAKKDFRSFLALSQYDPSDEALMVNEFQAYVLQRVPAEWTGFFRDRVLGKHAKGPEDLSRLNEFLEAARTLDALVHRLFGAKSGSVSTVFTP